MLNRKILKELFEWKNSENKKAILLYGARQIGKTYIVREFAKTYDSFIELNFLKENSLKEIFEEDLDVDTLIRNISFRIKDANLIEGKTLILLDEIQDCPNALTSLKFWSENRKYDVIATGSALGMKYKYPKSFPVGYVKKIKMDALDFEEFLWANGYDENKIAVLKSYFDGKNKISSTIHNEMMKMLRLYMVLGGMPDVINKYLETNNIYDADEIQRQLYQDYIFDIAKYADLNIKIKSEKCYKSIPSQLSKDNHKFQYKLVENKGNARKFESSIEWLQNAFFINCVYNVTKVEFPLSSYKDESNFRVYPSDIGMLIAAFPKEIKMSLLNDKELNSLSNNLILKNAKGAIYEALIADILGKKKIENLYFYKKENSTLEIEFIIENQDGVVPIEVKAGRSNTKSLNKLLDNDNVAYGYKLADQNIGVCGKKTTLPLYMIMFI